MWRWFLHGGWVQEVLWSGGSSMIHRACNWRAHGHVSIAPLVCLHVWISQDPASARCTCNMQASSALPRASSSNTSTWHGKHHIASLQLAGMYHADHQRAWRAWLAVPPALLEPPGSARPCAAAESCARPRWCCHTCVGRGLPWQWRSARPGPRRRCTHGPSSCHEILHRGRPLDAEATLGSGTAALPG
jgi:hypothetical protein